MKPSVQPMLPEIDFIEKATQRLGGLCRTEVLAWSEYKQVKLPIYKVSFGSTDPEAPVLGFFGGVHGVERIGAQVCISLLNTLTELVFWDETTREKLKKIRIYFVPTVNPVGILRMRRANPNGIDLMRNAPVESDHRVPFLIGGHRYTNRLPWYRGAPEIDMEVETKALIEAVQAESFKSPLSIAIDFHSGFGLHDQLWFPYSKTQSPFPDLAKFHSFVELMERTYPYHFYKIEPQSVNYTMNGDVWDYLYDRYRERHGPTGLFLPITLEMGSWMWLKKNPMQIFTTGGPFNPLVYHRQRRTLRRHNTFFEFLIRAVSSPKAWAELRPSELVHHEKDGIERWYGRFRPGDGT